MNNDEIIRYYQNSQWMYRLFCYTPKTLGMHFGFWDEKTKNRQEAILNQNREIIRVGKIRADMRILDAGCGVGGTAFYIAQTTGASVWGISLDAKQIQLAKQYAQKQHVIPLTHFSTQDYTHTNFPDNFFDVVYGIESICYASPKTTFLKETYRILKPEGLVIIHDGYLTHLPKTPQERRILKNFTWAFVLPPMTTNDHMLHDMSKAGFVHNTSINMLKKVLPSVRYFRRWGILTQLVCMISPYIPIKPIQAIYHNYLAIKSAEEGYRVGLADYPEHYGQKPLKNINRNTPIKRAKEEN